MPREKNLPSGRAARLSQFGGFVSNIVANMAIDGVKELSRGNVPALKDLLLTTKNISHLSERLAKLRGAAMKMGQLLSMDAGEFLPPELNQILSVLRDNAYTLPEEQLHQAMVDYLGKDWQECFDSFEIKPFAAASIGQVHEAIAKDGRKLAVKIQYPGVSKSIHSDVDNMGSLMKMSGLIPKNIDMTRLLLEVKMQLIRESDYSLETRFLERYAKFLGESDTFVLPETIDELCNENVITMTHVKGVDIETIAELPEDLKNRLCEELVRLLFREMFEFNLMQTDPNFANYLYQPDTEKIVLLDFGATRDIDKELSEYYRDVAHAALNQDMEKVLDIAIKVGFYVDELPEHFKREMLGTFEIAADPLQFDGEYDFAASDVLMQLKDRAMEHAKQRDYFGTPPGDSIFMHRKIVGIYLFLCRVKAKLNLRKLLEEFL